MDTIELKLKCLELAKTPTGDARELIIDAERIYNFVTGTGAATAGSLQYSALTTSDQREQGPQQVAV